MTPVEIKSLFNRTRLPDGVSKINIIVYFPIGLFLAVVRCFIFLHMILVCQVLPHGSSVRRFVLKIMSGVLGFFATWEGDKNEDMETKVIVSNHISATDNFLLDIFYPSVSPVEQLPPLLIQILSKYKQLPSNVNKEDIIKEVKQILQDTKVPLLFFPEKTTTNGENGLLKFSSLPFDLNESIKPVALKYKRPFLFGINLTTLESSWVADLFWCFFVPCTFYKIRVLPIVKKKEEESVEEFTERVRSSIAKCLNITATDYTFSDKKELTKQENRTTSSQRQNLPTTSNNSQNVVNVLSSDPAINNMVQQVKTVMPHVPISAILKDIEKTKDIDLTITNILDGIVHFTPEENDNQKNTESEKQQKLSCPSTQTFKSTTFGRTSKDRQLSFEERKKAMIEAARQKYKEKHNLL